MSPLGAVTTPRTRTPVPTAACRAWAMLISGQPPGVGVEVGGIVGVGVATGVSDALGVGDGMTVGAGVTGPISAASRGWTR